MDYDDYEKACEFLRQENDEYLDLFEQSLIDSGLSKKTIRNHMSNVDFYINDYLMYERPRPMKDGTYLIGDYLGYFFIRKCMWSTPGTVKSTAASIKKFYKCMAANEKISREDYDQLCVEIKDNMLDWQADCAQYNDPDAPNPFEIIF